MSLGFCKLHIFQHIYIHIVKHGHILSQGLLCILKATFSKVTSVKTVFCMEIARAGDAL